MDEIQRYHIHEIKAMQVSKSDLFSHLNCTFDFALPQDVLNQVVKASGLPYDLVLGTTVWAYPPGNYFGVPISACYEVQNAWNAMC